MGKVENARQNATILSIRYNGSCTRACNRDYFTANGISVDITGLGLNDAAKKIEQAQQKINNVTNPLYSNTKSDNISECQKKYEEKMEELDKKMKEYGLMAEKAITDQGIFNYKISSLYDKNGTDLSLWSYADKHDLDDYENSLSDARWNQVMARNGEFSTGIDKFLETCHFGKERINEFYGRMIQNMLRKDS